MTTCRQCNYAAIILSICLAGCATGNQTVNHQSNMPICWSTEFVKGYVIDRSDTQDLEAFEFLKDGVVSAEVGTKEGPWGDVNYDWQIIDCKLRIVDQQATPHIVRELTLLSTDGPIIRTQDRDGAIIVYRKYKENKEE